MTRTLIFALCASLALFAFAPAAAADPVTDAQCGAIGGCCPTAISCLCGGTSTVVGCVEKIVTETVILPGTPTACSEFTHTCSGELVCVTEEGATHCVRDPCDTTACTSDL